MQVLRAVVTSGSVSSAANNLGYTPSAISQQLATLEREAGTPLLEKAGRGVRPTPAGNLLAERAGTVTELLGEAEAELADIRAGRTGLLRVRFFHTAGVGLIPPAVAKFSAEWPDVQLELRMIDEGILGEVATGEADLAVIVVSREVPDRPGVRLLHLVDEPYRVVLPKDHPLCDQEYVDLAQLDRESWVRSDLPRGGPCEESLDDAFAAAGLTPRVVLDADGSYAAQGFVAAGIGVALQPKLAVDVVHPGVEVRPVRHPEPVRHIYIAVREATAERPAAQSFMTTLGEIARG
ncbi:LysR family transcriptional regulator [Parasphingorhabdus pacifica]